jgi:hypothetical protein
MSLCVPQNMQRRGLTGGFFMTDADQEKEDEALKRMLKTPSKPDKPKGEDKA